MSLKQVVPPRSISTAARRVPAWTNPSFHEPGLGRPDMLREPGVERHVVGETPEQGHRGVGVGVDEPRCQRVSVEVHALSGREPGVDLVRGAERGDGAALHGERVVLEDVPGRLDRDDPRSAQHEIRRFPVSHGANSRPQYPLRMPGGRGMSADAHSQGSPRRSQPEAGPFCSGLHDPRKKGPAPGPADHGREPMGCRPPHAAGIGKTLLSDPGNFAA